MILRGHKGVESKARPMRKSQFASCKSQVTQVDTVASQTLTLRGNECLILPKCGRVYIQESTATF